LKGKKKVTISSAVDKNNSVEKLSEKLTGTKKTTNSKNERTLVVSSDKRVGDNTKKNINDKKVIELKEEN
jgi:hypothetical protein